MNALASHAQARQKSERLTCAVELLAAAELARRLAGIYALEELCRESPGEQSAVVEILTSFVRRLSAWDSALAGTRPQPASMEVQAALTAIGRRHWPFSAEEKPLDLSRIALREAYLPFSHFERAFLFDCDFEGALLVGAHLQGAWLARTNLKNANLDYAHLEGADLMDARNLGLEQLRRAHLDGATRLPDGSKFRGF